MLYDSLFQRYGAPSKEAEIRVLGWLRRPDALDTFGSIEQRSLCCSPECSAIHAANLKKEYCEANAEALREKCREWHRQHGAERNARRREATKKRREEQERLAPDADEK